MDRAHFGRVTIGSALRVLWAFVMVLAWSRQVFVRFYPSASMPSFLRGTVTLVDHLVHRSEILEIDGDSYRLEEAKERQLQRSSSRRPKKPKL